MAVSLEFASDHQARPIPVRVFHEWRLPDGTLWAIVYRCAPGYLLRYPELAEFQVSGDGNSVHCWPVNGVSTETVQHLYQNQVLPLALSRQGKIVLHASAVEISTEGIAFIGESGRGKSTLTASFATNGYRFLTDDGLIVESVEGENCIVPSHPSIRLWEDSQKALIGRRTQVAPPLQYTSKMKFLAGDEVEFCDQHRRLRRVYFLGAGELETPSFEPLSPGEALIELVKHSFLLDVEDAEVLSNHFDALSNLVRMPIYYRLDYPRRFEDLPRVRQAIVEHALGEHGSE